MRPDEDLGDTLRRSVVKLFTVYKEPNHYQPWELHYQRSSGGSACILDGNRILTNAHVVAHQLHVQALKPGDSKKYTARVLHVDHDREAAILTVDDPAFFEETIPVRFGELPRRNADVSVYGFPMGGNELCVTAGVVSRLEVRTYTHSQRNLLALQTDAAINPGNSGGPVFQDGALVGIAFQSYRQKDLEKAGYVVPISILRDTLTDLEDGQISGVPDLGVYLQNLENEALRAFYRLPAGRTGVRVSRVLAGSSASGALQVDDVIMAIDGIAVANDGTVPLREHERVHFVHVVSGKQIGDRVTIELLRRGEPATVEVDLKAFVSLVPPPRPDRRPSYYIFGGIVFVVLTHEYMADWEWAQKHHRFRYCYDELFPSARRREVVLVTQVLAHQSNLGYHQIRGAIVERINGRDIAELRDVLHAVESPLDGFHVIETDYHGARDEVSDYESVHGTRIGLAAETAHAVTQDILAQHGIARDRSDDLSGR